LAGFQFNTSQYERCYAARGVKCPPEVSYVDFLDILAPMELYIRGEAMVYTTSAHIGQCDEGIFISKKPPEALC
jgi:hypothetical protein